MSSADFVPENIFINLFNVVAETDIDFPVIRAADAAWREEWAGP
jgi:hypothetical protein